MSDDNVLSNKGLENLKVKSKFKDFNGRDRKSGRFVKGNPGGGRPHGSKNIFTKKAAEKLSLMGADPIEILAELMLDPDQDVNIRMRAAEKLSDFAYSKQPTMTENKHDGAIPMMNVGMIPMEGDKEE